MRSRRPIIIIIAVLLLLNMCAAGYIYRIHKAAERSRAEGAEDLERGASELEEINTADEDLTPASHVYSHRGNGKGVEEHSFDGYDKAIRDGAMYIEQDLVVSADGTLYVSHDKTADRMTGKSGDFSSMTDSEIDSLKTHGGNRILKLSEVFDRYGRDVFYVIELKSTDSRAADSFRALVRESGLADRIILQCFSSDVLKDLDETFPDMEKILLCERKDEMTAGLDMPYVDIISVSVDLMNETNCKAVHDSGKIFSAWTLSSEPEIRRAIELGVDTYFTNDVPLALELEKKYRQK